MTYGPWAWLSIDVIDGETEKAFHVVMGKRSHWIAKSQCHKPEWYCVGLCDCTLAVGEWLTRHLKCEVALASMYPPTRKQAFQKSPILESKPGWVVRTFRCIECGRSRLCRRLEFFADIRPRCFGCGGFAMESTSLAA